MVCAPDRIVAASFIVIGSIGVVAQILNFYRLLKKNDIDVKLYTSRQFKYTLALFGEDIEQNRDKFRSELNKTHELFKQFIHKQRP